MFLSEYVYYTGKKGHHPSNPGYVPTLFPCQKNLPQDEAEHQVRRLSHH